MLTRIFAFVVTTVSFPYFVFAAPDDLRVEYITAEEQRPVVDLQLSGTLEAKNSVELGFRQSGKVIEVLVEEGDKVKKGDALARLDAVQQEQGLQVAEANLAAAQATEEQARQASQRANAMLDRGVGTAAARDEALQALSEAQGAVERAESSVDQTRRAVDDTVLRAPADSIVTGRDMSEGMITAAAQPVVSLASLDGLEAVFKSPDHPLLDDAMGAEVSLVLLDIDLPNMKGTVTEIAPLVDPATGTVTVRADVSDSPEGTALLGAAVRGHLRVEANDGFVIPWTAIARQGDAAAVWVVGGDNRVSLKPVEISYFSDHEVYISGGLEAGEVIVGAGSQMLYPGRVVQPAETRK